MNISFTQNASFDPFLSLQPLTLLRVESCWYFLDFHMNSIIQYVFSSFTQHNYLVIHPCWWYQYFITFYYQETGHCMDTSQYTIYPFTNCWCLLSDLSITNNAAIYDFSWVRDWNGWHIWQMSVQHSENYQTAFQSGSMLHSHEQCMCIPIAPYPSHYLVWTILNLRHFSSYVVISLCFHFAIS